MPARLACSLFLLLAAAAPSWCADACTQLNQRADELGLASAPYWHTLLHLRRGMLGARSLMDDPSFFIAEDGKDDPLRELEATIDALCAEEYEPEPPGTEAGQDGRSVRCRFPARYHWIFEQTSTDPAVFPPQECAEYEAMIKQMDPAGVTLVFSGYHPNGPASMFGHTLIRIDHGSGAPMLAYGMNNAALTNNNDNAIVYAFKGLTGFYPGYYSFIPYYQKIQQYSDSEQRDIWEYGLNLTRGEAMALVRHAWELRDNYADYYYFDENCSYNILFLLEAARPGVRLTEDFSLWVTPVDTIRAVEREGLVDKAVFRPSQAAVIRAKGERLTPSQRKAALSLGRGDAAPAEIIQTGETAVAPNLSWSDKQGALALEIAAELVKIDFLNDEISQEEYRRRYLTLLAARSKINIDEPEVAVPEPAPPETGHASSAITVAAGVSDGAGLYRLAYRPAYHALLDPSEGYVLGSEIVFSDLEVSYSERTEELRFDKFDLIRITSLSPWDSFFKPLSWKVQIGVDRSSLRGRPGVDDVTGALAKVGLGTTGQPLPGWLVYGLGDLEVKYGRQSGDWSGHYAAGPEAGVLANPVGALLLHLNGSAKWFRSEGETVRQLAFSLSLAHPLGKELSLKVDARRQLVEHEGINSWSAALVKYF